MSLFDVDDFVKKAKAQKAQTTIDDRTKALLRFMVAEMDLDKTWVAGLLEMCEVAPDLIAYIAGPIIVHRSAWMGIVPKWLFKAVVIDRLDRVYEEIATHEVGLLATPSEVVAYMIPATYEAPLSRGWTETYLWASSETLTKHKRMRDGKSPWEVIGGQPVAYSSIKHKFEQIAQDIRGDVVKHAKSNGWGVKQRQIKEEADRDEDNETGVIVEQQDLFSFVPSDDDTNTEFNSPRRPQQTNLFDLLGG
ncbi:MAG: hypothetical protein ICV78_26570 [Tolypothrix sp. Co-bin9]|nr:hypothetical protein [Tolypothrix sp. Co-bin9]